MLQHMQASKSARTIGTAVIDGMALKHASGAKVSTWNVIDARQRVLLKPFVPLELPRCVAPPVAAPFQYQPLHLRG